jgi:hypothetical protein
MLHVTAKVQDGVLIPSQSLSEMEGLEVEILIGSSTELTDWEKFGWTQLSSEVFENTWNTPEDSIYDDWRSLYGV